MQFIPNNISITKTRFSFYVDNNAKIWSGDWCATPTSHCNQWEVMKLYETFRKSKFDSNL